MSLSRRGLSRPILDRHGLAKPRRRLPTISAGPGPPGHARLEIEGLAVGSRYVLEETEDMATWLEVMRWTATSSRLEVDRPLEGSRKFWRVGLL